MAGTFDFDGTSFSVPVAVVTLAQNRLDYGSPQEVADVLLGGLEELFVNATTVQVTGTDGVDRVSAGGCQVSVRGGAGADRLSRAHLGVRKCNTVSSRLFGGTGADHLLGSRLSDDHLIGGRGRDVADGLAGTDTCRAEVTRQCEGGK